MQLARGDRRWRERAPASERARWGGAGESGRPEDVGVYAWRSGRVLLFVRAFENRACCWLRGSARSLPFSARGPAPSSPARNQRGRGGKRARPASRARSRPLSANGHAGADYERPPGTRASAASPAGRASVRAAQARTGRREPGPRRGALPRRGAEAPAPSPAGAARAPAAAAAGAAARRGPTAAP